MAKLSILDVCAGSGNPSINGTPFNILRSVFKPVYSEDWSDSTVTKLKNINNSNIFDKQPSYRKRCKYFGLSKTMKKMYLFNATVRWRVPKTFSKLYLV